MKFISVSDTSPEPFNNKKQLSRLLDYHGGTLPIIYLRKGVDELSPFVFLPGGFTGLNRFVKENEIVTK
jgi:hypothetical protein